MRYLIICCLLILAAKSTMAQIFNPIHWSYYAKKIKGDTYAIHITARMDPGWHIYASEQPKEAISEPTRIKFDENKMVIFNGSIRNIGIKELQEIKVLGIKQFYYADSVDFVQKVKLISKKAVNLSGKITYQLCTNSTCLQPRTISFGVELR